MKGDGIVPPRARITKDMVVEAALAVARRSGAESINARSVAQELGCSTQPVMYHFAMVEDLRRAAYDLLDRRHTEYLTRVPPDRDPLLGIGCNYIRFAVEEPNLFRFLFQSGYARESSLQEMIDSGTLEPVLAAMRAQTGLSAARMKDVFLIVALFAHGYASIIANNALEYDEETVARHLERAFAGAVLAVGEEEE